MVGTISIVFLILRNYAVASSDENQAIPEDTQSEAPAMSSGYSYFVNAAIPMLKKINMMRQ